MLKMGPRNLDFVLSEANGNLSYDEIVYAADKGTVEPGTALKLVAGKYERAIVADSLAGFACYRVDTTGSEQSGVVFKRDGEIKSPMIVWDASFTTQTEKDVALATLSSAHVIAR